ncbi:TlyA family RNA methyltransferase [uncultured Brevibacterium sp.]|uniref:TlyA family RNA methyltransferase n=1 Tax=uncultured Brevibacterium sp. TaxID=189678 RepID=UPI0025FE1079|nr:TlyA family RNA methyltransferase [uncultured Brevibacterium sp.]
MPRLDTELVARGLVASRNRAAREIAAGNVTVNGHPVTKPSHAVGPQDQLALTQADPWVARSAHKLLGAFSDLGIDRVDGLTCLDAGASTGGFTQVLLTKGATHVYAVDVGHDQLHASLRTDPRVTNLEGHNLRELTPEWTRGEVDLVVADVSFISLTLFIDRLMHVTRPGGHMLLMVKPQFELDRSALDKHGVVTSEQKREEAVDRVISHMRSAGAHILRTHESHLPGPSGNIEYFVYAESPVVSQGEVT